MASVHPRKNKREEITSWQVKWRLGGGRGGDVQTERFDDETSATVFKKAVDEAGQQWPPGWVKGKGYVAPDAADEERFRFRVFAAKVIDTKTGIEGNSRKRQHRNLERWINPVFGECDIRSAEHISKDTVRQWVIGLEKTLVHWGSTPRSGVAKNLRPMSPYTIRTLHGLLSNILNEAVTAEPPLRERNPCKSTRLPRLDTDGSGADSDDSEAMEFLLPQEVAGVISSMKRRSDQLLTTVAYGTGMRWGEITALAPMALLGRNTSNPRIRVRRAWKKAEDAGFYLGTPKSRRSRRTLRVSAAVVAALVEQGVDRLPRDGLLWTGDRGQHLAYSTFSGRWHKAVRAAKEKGLLPVEKHPTPHDLRHSHAALLISHGHSLTYVQRRLGHESIQTTSDTYGHLLPEADDNAMATIEAALPGERPRLRSVG
ncbi:tyrosine-type recombinase/integrase [Streptomyces sp. NBC_00670]|jgi:integrase|uniref:tyrosine-type recombinase/integrase n=1 Tax=Streptomyces sp. NBC_00670 TaxID=2975804 RepID=UPI002E37F06B|nr:site-specific integrase [Streptomyces sp. NBC_00670]